MAQSNNYLRDTALINNQLKLTFKYKIDKIKYFSLNANGVMKYIYDIKNGVLPSTKNISQYRQKGVKAFRIGQYRKNILRVVIESKLLFKGNYKVRGKILTINLPKYKKNISTPVVTKKSTTKKSIYKKNKTIIVDAGHGGRDRGAGYKGIIEKKLTLAISKKLKKALTKKGYKVIMTRNKDKYLSLKERTEFANAHRGSIFISIHSNAAPRRKSRHTVYKGIEVFYLSNYKAKRVKRKRAVYRGKSIYSRKAYKQMTSSQKIASSHRLSKYVKRGMLKSIRRQYSVVDKGIKRSDFWVLLATKMPSILIETGYISDRSEGKRLLNGHYQNLLVDGIVNGVDNYYHYK